MSGLKTRKLSVEPLESRHLLSALGLVDVGQQPVGSLSGKIVYTHAGHGWTADNRSTGDWTTQRPETFEMVEDLGNQDQMSLFVDYLFNAGATVVPLRPVGHQTNEVVLDNDDVGVTFSGEWSDSSESIFYGEAADVPFRYASTSAAETAVATYTPNISVAGKYPVYAWARSGSDRAADQLYRVTHSGGVTEVTVNHRRVGNGLVYLGSYHFEAGAEGYVEVSNRSMEFGRVVVADMIRFGNGMGDIDRGGGVSGVPREDESGLYWVKWHVDNSQGISDFAYRSSSNDRSAAVGFSPRYAAYMNRADDGSLVDRAFVSFHSNAGNGNARGVLGLYNGNNRASAATPNQFLMANRLANEINVDLPSQNGRFEHDWAVRNTITLDRTDIEFGEINNESINNEFDATIVETGFHDNVTDAEMLRDPRVRDALAKATYQGLVKYFAAVDASAGTTVSPGKVDDVWAEGFAGGRATVHWNPPIANGYNGGLATGYYVYASTNGYGFDGGTYVDGGNATSYTFSRLDPNEDAFYFKVVAANAGGQSPGSEVVGAVPTASSTKALVVNGFDRIDRTLSPVEPYGSGSIQRVRPELTNRGDYVVQHIEAITVYDAGLAVDSASNERVASGEVGLENYDAVVWILGEESSVDDTFDPVEQNLVSAYLAGGGKLFVSGAEIGWDLDQLGNGAAFYNDRLRANYVADDANTYLASGNVGSIFAGINVAFDDGTSVYDVTYPDVISPFAGSTAAMSYVGGSGGTAAVQYGAADGEQLVMLGFPFEAIVKGSTRNLVMERVLTFFELEAVIDGDYNLDGVLNCDDISVLSRAVQNGIANVAFDANGDAVVDKRDIEFWLLDIKGTVPGDANLDFVVDIEDFQLWNAHRFANGTNVCQGDFNFDAMTDVSDFNVWNTQRSAQAAAVQYVDQAKRKRTDIRHLSTGQWKLSTSVTPNPRLGCNFALPLETPRRHVRVIRADLIFAKKSDDTAEGKVGFRGVEASFRRLVRSTSFPRI